MNEGEGSKGVAGVVIQEPPGGDRGAGFTALFGDGDLADLTKGNDKRETVGLRGKDFRVVVSIWLLDDSDEVEGDSGSLAAKSDESYNNVESLDLIRGINMRWAVRGEGELGVMGDMTEG